MAVHFETCYASNADAIRFYATDQIRNEFLITNIMQSGAINLTYSHYDRYIAGGAVPLETPLTLDTINPLKADYFLERRELGIINVGAAGIVNVDGNSYKLGQKDTLYVGKGNKKITFSSVDASAPAKFYLNSAPAHVAYPTKKK